MWTAPLQEKECADFAGRKTQACTGKNSVQSTELLTEICVRALYEARRNKNFLLRFILYTKTHKNSPYNIRDIAIHTRQVQSPALDHNNSQL